MRILKTIIIGLCGAASVLTAQTHFTFTSFTGSNAQIGIPVTVNPNVSGSPLVSGDEIGAFTPGGLCVGAVVWVPGATNVITAWGDDPQTSEIDGMQDGEVIQYRVWKLSTDTEYASVAVTYSEGTGEFFPNTVHVLSSLTATAPPDAPALTSPSDSATNLPTTVSLSWDTTPRADWYRVQVSTDVSFTSFVANDSLSGTSFQATSLLNDAVYYWRVNAGNSGGLSAWSAVRTFTTVPLPPSAPALGSPANNSLLQPTTLTLSWNATQGADSYYIQVSTTPAFSSFAVDDSSAVASFQTTTLSYATAYYWRARSANAGGSSAWSEIWQFRTIGTPMTHGVVLGQGWNMVSGFVQPQNPDIEGLSSSIQENLVIIKNGNGQVYWPAIPVNNIGDWDYEDGYQVYILAADTLMIPGNEIIPETDSLSLAQGWHLISYLRNNALAVDSALSTIRANIVIVKNNAGEVYWPTLSFDNLGTLKPGQGYQVYLSAVSTLIYPPNAQSSPGDVVTRRTFDSKQVVSVPHFSFTSRTGNNATVGIPTSAGASLTTGDHIGVFTPEGLCVGAVAWSGSATAITIWGDDERTSLIDGIRPGETLSYRIWRPSVNDEQSIPVTYSDGDGLYRPNGIQVLSALGSSSVAGTEGVSGIPMSYSLKQNYPNPFNPSTIIRYELPEATHVVVRLFDVLGRQVATLVDEEKTAGRYSVEFNARSLPSGLYFYKLETSNYEEIMKMLLVR